MLKGSSVYYYSKDGLGSVVNLTDNTGQVVESYTYDEYGNLTSAPSQVGNRYLYTGREYDPEVNLYYYRARYYDPSMGRFLQTDPIGYIGGINPYVYVKNNPVNWVDPWGLNAKKNSPFSWADYASNIRPYAHELGRALSRWGKTAMEYGTYAEVMGVASTLLGQPEIGGPLAVAGAAASTAGLIEAILGELLQAF